MTKTTVTTASVLAFERKLANSDAQMFAGDWHDCNEPAKWTPVEVKEKAVRGTISNRMKNGIATDSGKLDAEIQKPNLQRVDVAALPFDADTLKLRFTLRVLGNLSSPSVCNDQDYQAALAAVIDGYRQEHGFSTLAARYAENLANGRFLWRNRIGAEGIAVHVTHNNHCWIFEADGYNLREFSKPAGDLAALAAVIEEGLSGNASVFLSVEAFARLGAGQEVFPSQELVLDSSRDSKKSKILYQTGGVAALHSQKIGNALRTVDDWYPQASEFELGPIAVEPYGSVTSKGRAYRQPGQKVDFYTLLDNWVTKDKKPDAGQQHYVMATLIRGGVFGAKGE
ncbi:type I-F CRISPR-associated protein Csy3 [Rahnella woolbedingensis]|uniref:Type I-F CRISPR-associated protein Csy3 n=1 Tax=Rahnella woolbedingensis TaxID=1510574 RepID=A0A419NE67_9GAMM|nr:type I-F CRISPR-associated protein Csy3 [Rahnella woolbedingensis]RJT47047.1 type I-F CRISPR-associated protein Csy3 [Rahnella woolbedingensis]